MAPQIEPIWIQPGKSGTIKRRLPLVNFSLLVRWRKPESVWVWFGDWVEEDLASIQDPYRYDKTYF
jgi:hypothetical protein